MSDQEFEAKLKQRGKERDKGVAEGLGNLKNIGDLVKQSHDKIRASIQSKVGMTQDQINDAGAKKIKAKWKNIGDEIIKSRLGEAPQGVAEGLVKYIKRLATGKDVKSRAGQEIAKSQDAIMKGDTKTSKKHFDRYDKLDKLANKGQGVAEGWESGPEERTTRERDPDAEYDARRQEKLDAEADKAQAKRPQTKVYSLSGRGPNQEPNYAFPGEYDSQDAADAARKKLMADPKTPNPRDIGIRSRTKYTEDSVTPLRDLEDYQAKKKALQDIQTDPDTNKDPELSLAVMRRLAGLEKQRSELK